MTDKMTQADFDAMFDAASAAGIVDSPVHDPKAAKLQRDQDTARLSVKAEEELREPSLGEKASAAAVGVAESATAGLSPYVYGAMKALAPFALGAGAIFTNEPITGIPKRFREGVEEQRGTVEHAQEGKRGAAFGAGHLAADVGTAVSGVAAPVKSAITAGKAIAGGAPAASVLKTGMRPLIDQMRGALAEPLTAMGSGADRLRALTPTAAVGSSINEPKILKEIQTFPGDVKGYADWMRDRGISKGFFNTSTGIEKRSANLLKSSGEAIGEQIARATSKGGTVDADALVQSLRDQADQVLVAGGVTDESIMHAAKLREFADRLAAKFTGGTAPIENIKQQSIEMGRASKTAAQSAALGHPVKGNALATLDARRTQEEAILDALEGAGIDPADVKKAKLDFMGSRITNQNANAALGRAEKSGPFNMMEGIIATKSAPLAAAYKATRPLWASTKAAGAETARSLGKAVTPALTSAQTATVQRALAAGQAPQTIAQSMSLPLDAIEALAVGTAVRPSSALALGKSTLAGNNESDLLEAMKKRLAAP